MWGRAIRPVQLTSTHLHTIGLGMLPLEASCTSARDYMGGEAMNARTDSSWAQRGDRKMASGKREREEVGEQHMLHN